MVPKMHKWDIVQVRWNDIQGRGPAWEKDEEDDFFPAECETVGYILYKNKKYITLCGSIAEDNVSDKTVIPRGCIVWIKVLGHADTK